jgi:AcrR family transcriptional regulator
MPAKQLPVIPTAEHEHASPWKPLEARQKERAVKRHAVLRAATRLFLERGWHRATMQELAERLNITKPALYNYFTSKDDVLKHCILLNNEKTEAAFAAAEALPGNGLDRLRVFLKHYVGVSTSESGACVNRIDDREMQKDLRQEFVSIKRAIDSRVRMLIEAGIKDGSIVPCDVRITTFAMMGAIQWISRWYRRDGPLTREEIGEEFAIRLTSGVAASGASKAKSTQKKASKRKARTSAKAHA